MDCTLESPTFLHKLHVNKDKAATQFSARVDTPPFSPTATIRSSGQSLPPVLEEVTKTPTNSQNSLPDGHEPSPLQTVDVPNPRASYAFSQLHKYMESRFDKKEPQAVNWRLQESDLNRDSPPAKVKKASQTWKDRSTEPSIEILLQRQASFQFNAVLVELLELVPPDSSTSRLLQPVKLLLGSSSTTPEGFGVSKSRDGVVDAVSASQTIAHDLREDLDSANQTDGVGTPDRTLKCNGPVKIGVGDILARGTCPYNANNSDVREEFDLANQTDGTGVVDASQPPADIANVRDDPEPPDQTNAVDVLDALTAGKKTDGVDVLDSSPACQNIANNASAEPDLDKQNDGDDIGDRILKWESKGKSILVNDDELQSLRSPVFDDVMKELRDADPLASKFQKSEDETGDGSPGSVIPTGCNAFRFLFA